MSVVLVYPAYPLECPLTYSRVEAEETCLDRAKEVWEVAGRPEMWIFGDFPAGRECTTWHHPAAPGPKKKKV